MAKDKVTSVRMEFATSIESVKPFLEYDVDLHLGLLDLLTFMRSDPDKDVVEAVDRTDEKMMSTKKKTKKEEQEAEHRETELRELEKKLLERESRVLFC
jgi:hypothetical protein